MWIIGIVGMALKSMEVTQSMLFRDTTDPNNPHGGPMFVVAEGMKRWGLGTLGQFIGVLFCLTLLISAVTGGNMFQANQAFQQIVEATGSQNSPFYDKGRLSLTLLLPKLVPNVKETVMRLIRRSSRQRGVVPVISLLQFVFASQPRLKDRRSFQNFCRIRRP